MHMDIGDDVDDTTASSSIAVQKRFGVACGERWRSSVIGFPTNKTRPVCVCTILCCNGGRRRVRPDHLRARVASNGRGFRCYFTVCTIKTHGTPPAHGRRAYGPWQHRRATTPGRARAAAAAAVQAGTVMFCF